MKNNFVIYSILIILIFLFSGCFGPAQLDNNDVEINYFIDGDRVTVILSDSSP